MPTQSEKEIKTLIADTELNLLLLDQDFWYILGIGLILLDILVGLDFFALAFGVGAILTGMLIDFSVFPSWVSYWERALLLFSFLSLFSLMAIKRLIPKGRREKDINDY